MLFDSPDGSWQREVALRPAPRSSTRPPPSETAPSIRAADATRATLPVTQPRSGARNYLAGLKAELSIRPEQTDAWSAVAEALSANGRRMRNDSDHGGEPFGSLPGRLAALEAMRRAAERLFGVLHPAQRRVASQVLPLCCLPRPAGCA